MFASPFSANVILAKARAMYGNSLKPKNYTDLLNCRSVSEIASYLKNNTSYSSALLEINESTIHRGHLEILLRHKLFNDYASLARYDKTVGMRMSDYIIERGEIELIITCLRLMSAGRSSEFFFSMPMFFSSHTHLDLGLMSRSKNYNDFLNAMQHTIYYNLLKKFAPNDKESINLTKIENALYTKLTQTIFRIINNEHGSTRSELKNLYGILVDVQNVTRILRLKNFFKADPDFIRSNLLPYGNSISKKAMDNMINAPTAEDVIEIFYSTPVGKSLPQSQRTFIHDIHHRVPYFAARRLIHYSINPAVVLLSYILLTDIELDDIINIIEGVRYGLQPEVIKPMLVLANY